AGQSVANYTVSTSVSDDDGLAGNASTAVVTVSNVAPTLSGLGVTPGTINENGMTNLTGTIADVGALDTFTLVVNWGDGAPQTVTNLTSGPINVAHRYLNNSPVIPISNYTGSATVTDNDGASAPTATTVATVDDVAPTASAFVSQTVSSGIPTSLTGSFTDPGTQDTFSF